METGNTHVYFALKGDNFDPQVVTDKLGIIPTETWKYGDLRNNNIPIEHSGWKLSTEKGKEYLFVDRLIEEVIDKLYDKIGYINELKNQYNLQSVLEIVLYIDTNEAQSTPALGHDFKTIEFLYRTKTVTDVDMYRFNSAE